MFRSFGDGKFAIGLIVGVVIVNFVFLWVFSVNYCPDAPCHYQKVPNQTETYTQRWFPIPWNPNSTLKPQPEITEGGPKQYEYDDLKAQENMARATNFIAWATLATTITSVFGVWLLVSNLSVTREVGRDQSRAYVHADKVDFFWGGEDRETPRVEVWARNTGQTPTKWYEIRIKESVYAYADMSTNPLSINNIHFPDKFSGKWNAIPPDDTGTKATTYFDVEGSQIEKAHQGVFDDNPSHGFSIFGEIRYCTIYDEIFVSQFCFGRPVLPSYERLKTETRNVDISGLNVVVNDHHEKPIILSRFATELEIYKRK